MSLPVESKYLRLISSRLRNFKQKKDNLWNFSCPFCGDSKKNLSKARGYVFAKSNNLFYNCHNCGVGTNVGNLIKHVDPSLHKEYVLERYKSGESGFSNFKAPTFDIPSPRFDKLEKQKVFEHAEWCDKLPSGHFCLEYLTRRKIPSEFHNKLLFTSHYKQFIDALVPDHGKQLIDDARVIIPFYDVYNNLIAVSGRALENSDKTLRYITIRTVANEDKLVYGMDRVDLNQLVKIVEGPIDSLFLSNCLASGDANLSLTSKNISAGKKVLIFDNEPRNKEIVKMMNDAIKSNNYIVIWPDTIEAKDINEMIMTGMSQSEVESIISSNTFSGLEAQTKFVFWKKV
jgi:transcription elongation factor Elf1